MLPYLGHPSCPTRHARVTSNVLVRTSNALTHTIIRVFALQYGKSCWLIKNRSRVSRACLLMSLSACLAWQIVA